VEEFKKRFGKRIPDYILRLFFEDELYAYALSHKIGRELVCDAFFHTSDLIKKIALLSDREEIKIQHANLGLFKELLRSICNVVKTCEDTTDELNIRNAFSKEDWEVFYNKCNTVERYHEEKKRLDNGRVFYAAYKTRMSKEVEASLGEKIESGYKAIWEEKAASYEVSYLLQLCRAIKALWSKRLTDYGKNLERIQKMIYREN